MNRIPLADKAREGLKLGAARRRERIENSNRIAGLRYL
jgi:hypothetical protein